MIFNRANDLPSGSTRSIGIAAATTKSAQASIHFMLSCVSRMSTNSIKQRINTTHWYVRYRETYGTVTLKWLPF